MKALELNVKKEGVRPPWSSVTDAASHVMIYGYDTENNLTSITDANNNTTSFSYDVLAALRRQASLPLTENNYDAVGNLLRWTCSGITA
jgi:YD repeat-containing protein